MQGKPGDQDPYVKRNLDLDKDALFFDWCIAASVNPTRLRSVIGPPGCGKTTFLRRLLGELQASGQMVVWYDAAAPPPAGVPGAAILLADGYDEVDDRKREWVEQEVFTPFLFPADVPDPQTRIVMSRRDELALRAARLRWEDVRFPLEGLEAPRRQIEALMALPPDAGVVVPAVVPAHVVAAIAALSPAAREALLDALQDSLTPNPFVNLCLLEEQLQHLAAPLAPQDYRDCLARYVARARLDGKYVDILIRRARQFPTGQFNLREYDDKQELGALVGAGAISHVHDSPRFQLEAAILRLVAHM